ncbi:MAG: C45 family autoproteolytic acyltransferase/hydrolase, partial [Bryobacteraceae bacterium]
MRRSAVLFCAVAAVSFRLAAAPPPYQGTFEENKWDTLRGTSAFDANARFDKAGTMRLDGNGNGDSLVWSAPLQLTIGKRYEVSGYIRTSGLKVQDTGRSPISIGAALSMASMPYDVHSESIAGDNPWKRVSLRFVATRSDDRIVLTAGLGGAYSGKAWFGKVSLDEVSASEGTWPVKAALKTFGPAYRYPIGGWIYLHIEGKPYERGYQHGFLLPNEIVGYIDRAAAQLDPRSRDTGWRNGRNTANALFLRGFDKEILEEMKGIAEGAAAAGAKYNGRPIDLVDIVTANTVTELGLLNSALPMTPSGLEGLNFQRPQYFDEKRDVPVTERCSAFAATGKATRDGKMVMAHLTMWPLTLAEQTNILLDIQPTSGHRMLLQAYPGGIQSGTDWYQNDAGMVLTETTIRQSPFNVDGTPVAYRARKAIQYGENVEQVAQYLGTKNNGLYTNEWLIGDGKNNEIAMFELGTYKTKLWRSSKNEWFGGTEGFYWGNNNAKDLAVRMEYVPDPKGAPQDLPFVPAVRDEKWQSLYHQYKGKIDEQFAFLAMRTAPLVSSTTMDAKVTTADMAKNMMTWVQFGKPNDREWVPSASEKQRYKGNNGIYSSGYRLATAFATDSLKSMISGVEKERLAGLKKAPAKDEEAASYKDKLWNGWLLPASDADRWLVAGSAAYHDALSSANPAKELDWYRARYRGASYENEMPLSKISASTRSSNWHVIAMAKGVLALDALRHEMGDDPFFALMKNFFEKNTTKAVTTAQFVAA